MTPGMWQWCCCGGGSATLAIVWTDSINQNIQIAEYVNNEWRYEEVAVVGLGYGYRPRLVYDHNGKPYIAYMNAAWQLYLAYRNGDYGSGYTSVLVSNITHRLKSIAVDSSNNIHVAHQGFGANPSIYIDNWDGSVITQHELANSQFAYISFSLARITSYGNIITALTYNETPTPPDYFDEFELHSFDGLTWTKESVGPDISVFGLYTPTVIDNNTLVFAKAYQGDITLLVKTGSSISKGAVLDSPATDIVYNCYAYKNTDDSYTVYCLRKSGPNYLVQSANYASSAWSSLTFIQNTGAASTSMDMKAKNDGTRYITYSVNSGGPRFLKYSSGSWTQEVLATGLSTNAYSSSIYVPGAIDADYD